MAEAAMCPHLRRSSRPRAPSRACAADRGSPITSPLPDEPAA